MHLKRAGIALLATLTFAGCVYVPLGKMPKLSVQDAALTVGGTAQIQATPVIANGGLSIQSVVTPWGQSDVNHLTLKLFVVAGGSEIAARDGQGNAIEKDIANADLSKAVAFGNLHHDTTYRIRGYAYSDVATASPISVDASSSVDVVVARDDRPVLSTVPIALLDKPFDGQATASNVVVTDGGLVDNGTETIQ